VQIVETFLTRYLIDVDGVLRAVYLFFEFGMELKVELLCLRELWSLKKSVIGSLSN
jgi:hypothetical protein